MHCRRLDIANERYTRCEQALLNAIENSMLLPLIKKRYTELQASWTSIQNIHDEYCATDECVSERLLNTDVIKELQARFNGIEEKVERYIDNVDRKQTKNY